MVFGSAGGNHHHSSHPHLGPKGAAPGNSHSHNKNKKYSTSRSDTGEDTSDAGGNTLQGGEDGVLEDQRKCVPFQVDFCRQLPYNFTSYPNAMGHRDVIEAKHDIERFK